jgi:hypothetical protein
MTTMKAAKSKLRNPITNAFQYKSGKAAPLLALPPLSTGRAPFDASGSSIE